MLAAFSADNLLPYLITGLTVGGIYSLSALGLVVVHRATGVVNFAQGAIGAIAALIYSQEFALKHRPLLLGLVISIAVSVVLSFFYGFVMAPRLAHRDAVVKAIGYYSKAPAGVPMNGNGTIANKDGWVSDNLWVVGWSKRGPSGTIPTNGPESRDVAQRIAANYQAAKTGDKPGGDAVQLGLVRAREEAVRDAGHRHGVQRPAGEAPVVVDVVRARQRARAALGVRACQHAATDTAVRARRPDRTRFRATHRLGRRVRHGLRPRPVAGTTRLAGQSVAGRCAAVRGPNARGGACAALARAWF